MTQLAGTTQTEVVADIDLATAVQHTLETSAEPLTLSRLRASLPASVRSTTVEELTEVLRRQVAANVLWQYPRYRSQQDRFWARPMPEHIAGLLRAALEAGPLGWSELRRKLPAYAQTQADTVLNDQIAQGRIYRHPRSGRSGERFALKPPDPRDYLRPELAAMFQQMTQLGFTPAQLRAGALELLHEEEWETPSRVPASPATEEPATATTTEQDFAEQD